MPWELASVHKQPYLVYKRVQGIIYFRNQGLFQKELMVEISMKKSIIYVHLKQFKVDVRGTRKKESNCFKSSNRGKCYIINPTFQLSKPLFHKSFFIYSNNAIFIHLVSKQPANANNYFSFWTRNQDLNIMPFEFM